MRTLSCNESTNTKDSSTCTSNKNLSKQPIGILRTASSCIYGILYIRFFWPAARRCHVQEGLWRSKCVKSQSGTLSSQDRAPPKTHRDSNQVTGKHTNPVNHEPWNSGCKKWKDPYFMSCNTTIPEINCGSISSPIRTKILGFKPAAPGGQPQVLLV